jgi:hypothetical protein
MEKNFALICIFFVVLLVITAPGKGEKVQDIKISDLNVTSQDIQSRAAVKPDLNFGKFPLYFITNKGQVNKKAKFYARASRYTLWLTKKGLVFDSVRNTDSKSNSPHSPTHPLFKHDRDVSRLIFIGANKNPEMIPIEEAKLRVNYFIGNDKSKWHCDIPTSRSVLYKNLYKHIDLKVYGIEKQVEYDWIVKPGGNPGDIRFEYKNVKGTRLDSEGNLVIETDFGELIHKKPVSYQAIRMDQGEESLEHRIEVEVEFKKIGDNSYGFEVGDYEKCCELIIDPVVLMYSTFLWGEYWDEGWGIAVDNSGNAYVTGNTFSADFPILNQYQTAQGEYDVFLTKIDTTQSGASSLVYSTYLGGSATDYGYGIAVDSNENAYVTGDTTSMNFPILNQYQTYKGWGDVFVTKIDTTQSGASSFIYSTYLGGCDEDVGFGIAVDSNENAYVTGQTSSTDFPTLNQYQTDQGGIDVFVTKIDTTQSGAYSLIYSTYLGGGEGWERGWGIAVDIGENAYVTGYTKSTDFPTLDQYQTFQGYIDAFVTKIDTTQSGASSLLYSTYLGGEDYDQGRGIAVDGSGNAYVTGYTESTDFPTLNQYQTDQLNEDVFVTKIDTTQSGASSLIYSTYLGGEDWDRGRGIAVDGSENAYVTGVTYSTDFPTLDQYQTDQGGCDAFITKIDTTQSDNSSLIYSTYLGGYKIDYGLGIAVDSSGYVYVTGSTLSSDFPILNQFQTYQGYYYMDDVFITKLINFSMTVTSPNGGESWYLGETEIITWEYSGFDNEEQIRLKLVKNDSVPGTIAENIQISNGSYTWNVGEYDENMAIPDNDYKIKIETMDEIYSDQSNENFSIENPITVISPNGGETLVAGSTHKITWKSSDNVGNVKIAYSTNNGASWRPIANYRGDDTEYDWKVPEHLSENCLVRIREINGDPSDVSDAVFSIVLKPSITIISPNGGENLEANSSYKITWTSIGNVDDVRIKYSTNNGTSWTVVVESTPNDGVYEWTVPDTISDDCLILIGETDGAPSDVSDAVFAIVQGPLPTITVTSPNGGESWEANSSHDITWTSTGNIGNVKIDYSINNGSTWKNIVISTDNDGIYNWTVPDTPSNDCLVRIREYDEDGILLDVSDANFSIVPHSSPIITVISPDGGEALLIDSIYEITWTSSENIENVKIKYSINNGETWTDIIESTPNDGSYEWPVPNTPSDDCLVRISDTDDDPMDDSNAPFSIITGPNAAITVTSPNGGENMTVGSNQEITWNSTGEVGNVIIEYSLDSGASWFNIATSTENDGCYYWTVPDNPSDNCLVKISETGNDDGPSDISNEEFSIVPPSSETITVTSPNGREVLDIGSTHEITWTTTGTIDKILIEYSTNSGASWTLIVSGTENDGCYNWTVPDTPSDNCLVRIKENDDDGEPSDVSDAEFSIVLPSYAAITITSPNGGESLFIGSTHNITWNSTGNINNVKIEYSIENGIYWDEVIASTPNDGIYEWTIPNVPNNPDDCLIRITDIDSDIFDISDAVFSIILSSTITITYPNGGEVFEAGSSYEITWESTGTVGNVKIEYSSDSGNSWLNIVNIKPNDGSFSWTVPDDPSENCLVRIKEADEDGNAIDVSDAEFSIVLPSYPTITVNTPNGGEHLIVDSIYEITWTSTGEVGNVKIEYSTNSGTSWTEIVDSMSNDGSYDWTVPDNPSDNCLIRVSEIDDDPSDVSDGEFSITSPSSDTITVTSPNGGESLVVDSTHEITWTSQGSIDYVMIEYSIDNGFSWIRIAASTVNSGSYNWTVPDTPSDECLVRISGDDIDDEPSDVSDAVYSIVSQIPESITVTSPNGGERLKVGSTHEITWTSTGAIDNVLIEYSFDNGVSWIYIVGPTVNDGSYEWTVPDTPSANCLVRVSGSDSDGQPFDVSDSVFSIISET